MKMIPRALALMTALAVGTVAVSTAQEPARASRTTPSTATTQDKKKTDDKKKDDKTEAKKVGTIEVYKAKDGFRFRINNADGKAVAISTKGLETKDEVLKQLDEIKDTLNTTKPVETKK